jgi:hypothetical protein
MDTIRAYNFTSTSVEIEGYGSSNLDPSTTHVTWANSLVDSLTWFHNPNTGAYSPSSNINTWGSAPAGYQTRDQIITTLLSGLSLTPGASYTARKAQLVNMMLWRPDIDWARILLTIGLPTLGLSSTYGSASPPNLSTETPAVIY